MGTSPRGLYHGQPGGVCQLLSPPGGPFFMQHIGGGRHIPRQENRAVPARHSAPPGQGIQRGRRQHDPAGAQRLYTAQRLPQGGHRLEQLYPPPEGTDAVYVLPGGDVSHQHQPDEGGRRRPDPQELRRSGGAGHLPGSGQGVAAAHRGGVFPVGQEQGQLRRHRHEQFLRDAAAGAGGVAPERRRFPRVQAEKPHAGKSLLPAHPSCGGGPGAHPRRVRRRNGRGPHHRREEPGERKPHL